MKKLTVKNDGNKSSVFNFGVQGWFIIVFCLLMFWIYCGMANSGTNVTAPALAAKFGVQVGTILTMNTIAGLFGIIFFIVIGQINQKIGARITAGIFTIVAGAAYLGVGNSVNLVMYTVCMCFVVGSMMSAGYIAGGALVSQWFPKKKGIVMGYTTMGHNLASAAFVPIISFLVGRFGIERGVVPVFIFAVTLGVVGLFLLRNKPQERGLNPDNVSDDVYKNEYWHGDEKQNLTGGWTTKKLLTLRETWLVALTTGMFQICSLGVVTQFVIRNKQLGFSHGQALMIVSMVACIGLVGSWIIGLIDERMGTKKTMTFFGIWYALSLLANATEIQSLIYLSIFMIGMSIGGSANFTTSLTTSVFGRQGFNKVNSVVFPIQGALASFSFLVNGVVSNLTGGNLRYAYIVLACIALTTSVLIRFVDEYRFNRDRHQEEEALKQSSIVRPSTHGCKTSELAFGVGMKEDTNK